MFIQRVKKRSLNPLRDRLIFSNYLSLIILI
ncbi:hypothetical protein cce_2035 [Crocosphaera subtropica ATCC 51142]|uniref:Uncharacterized protein n=1 Tax=Crocosphaera subtropica (strain ATCC 51142 / BH68) TaxID=43989 RepID=B1X1F6_CROS5|nr:hypothetical protein cce_2035 [Crocosphaera subtropica ATCC 51142]